MSAARKFSVRLQRADLIPRVREAMLRRHAVTVHRRPSDAAVIDFALATTALIECRENTPDGASSNTARAKVLKEEAA